MTRHHSSAAFGPFSVVHRFGARFRLAAGVALLSAGVVMSACDSGSDVGEPGAVVEEATGASGAEAPSDSTPMGMISSGTAAAVPTVAEPQRPTQEGQQSATTAEAAAEKVPFGLLEPTDLPMGTYRDLVYLIEPMADAPPSPNLPAVRFLYTLDTGSISLTMTPATGEPAEGEAVTIGAHQGWQVSADPPHYIWEQDGVRLELRGTVPSEVALAAAASMAPLGSWDEDAFRAPDVTVTPPDAAPAATPAITAPAGGDA